MIRVNRLQLVVLCSVAAIADFSGMASADCRVNPTPLQKHVMFFDANGDCIITRQETAGRLTLLPNIGQVAPPDVIAGIIHKSLGPRSAACDSPNQEDCIIDVNQIAEARHGAHTTIFGPAGTFDDAMLDRIFEEFDNNPRSGYLNISEIQKMIEVNAKRFPAADPGAPADAAGSMIAMGGFGALIAVAADHRECAQASCTEAQLVPALSKTALKKMYEGTLFYELAHETPPWERSVGDSARAVIDSYNEQWSVPEVKSGVVLAGLLDVDAIYEDPLSGGPIRGREQVVAFIQEVKKDFSNLRIVYTDDDRLPACDDADAIRASWRVTGRHVNGCRVDISGVDCFSFAGPRIRSVHGNFDAAAFAEQINPKTCH